MVGKMSVIQTVVRQTDIWQTDIVGKPPLAKCPLHEPSFDESTWYPFSHLIFVLLTAVTQSIFVKDSWFYFLTKERQTFFILFGILSQKNT